MRYVLEPTGVLGEWVVTVSGVAGTVFEGGAQDCIDWCLAQGARRVGPRVFVMGER
jgi:hypothetical protein